MPIPEFPISQNGRKPRFLLMFTLIPKKHKTAVKSLFTAVSPIFYF